MRLREISEAENPAMKTWRLSPFATLPPALRYCEAATDDEAAKILGQRLANRQWSRTKGEIEAIEKVHKNGPLTTYQMTCFRIHKSDGEKISKTVRLTVSDAKDDFYKE